MSPTKGGPEYSIGLEKQKSEIKGVENGENSTLNSDRQFMFGQSTMQGKSHIH